jgi:hypothetical protein
MQDFGGPDITEIWCVFLNCTKQTSRATSAAVRDHGERQVAREASTGAITPAAR